MIPLNIPLKGSKIVRVKFKISHHMRKWWHEEYISLSQVWQQEELGGKAKQTEMFGVPV